MEPSSHCHTFDPPSPTTGAAATPRACTPDTCAGCQCDEEVRLWGYVESTSLRLHCPLFSPPLTLSCLGPRSWQRRNAQEHRILCGV